MRYTCVANLHSYCGGRVEAGGGPGYLASPGWVHTSEFIPNFTLGTTVKYQYVIWVHAMILCSISPEAPLFSINTPRGWFLYLARYPQFYLGGRECVWSLVADQVAFNLYLNANKLFNALIFCLTKCSPAWLSTYFDGSTAETADEAAFVIFFQNSIS